MSYNTSRVSEEFERARREALELHHSGDIEASISAFREALSLVPPADQGSSQVVRAKHMLAFDLLSRDEGSDRSEAVALYKELIADENLSNLQRAIAVSELASVHIGDDVEFARTTVFAGSPYASFWQRAQGDIGLAIRHLFEYGEELFPLSFNEFSIANWYAYRLEERDILGLDEATQASYLERLIEWHEKGEKNLPMALSLPYYPARLGYIHQARGVNQKTIADFTNQDYATAEASLAEAVRILDSYQSFHEYGMSLYARFHYAAMLADVYGEERLADIREILSPILNVPSQYQGQDFYFYDFLRVATARPGDSREKADIRELANLVPEFRSFLQSLGLNY